MQEPSQPPKDDQIADPVKSVGTEVQENDETARGEPVKSASGVVPTPEQTDNALKDGEKAEQATAPASSAEPEKEPTQPEPEALKSITETQGPIPEAVKEPLPVNPQSVTPADPVLPSQSTEGAPVTERATPEQPPFAQGPVADAPADLPVQKPQTSEQPVPSSAPEDESDVPGTAATKSEQAVQAVKSDLPASESKPEAGAVASAPSEVVQDHSAAPADKPTSAAVEALEKSVRVAELEAEAASQAAVQAVVQASNLSRAAAVPYEPPMPVPTQLVSQPPAGAANLEAQAAAVTGDIARRQQAVDAYRAKAEEEEKQKAAYPPERPPQPSYPREESLSPQERAMPPRRAASARAAQVFKKDADDYLSESAAESPPDSPRQKKTPPKPKPQLPPAKPAQSKDSGASAWEEPPQKQLVLKITDITKALQKKWLQLYWPDDGKWWPCQVVFVDPRKKTANVLYETGEEEADLELAEMVQKGEVAWLNASDAHKEVEQPSRGRKADYDYDDDEEEDAWAPGRKRRAAAKSSARYEESEPESSESESPPPSDQSSDWRSSEDDDKPAKKRPKKKRRPVKPAPRISQPSHHHPQSRDRHGGHDAPMGRSSLIGRGSIFDDTPEFGRSFAGGSEPLRSQVQQRNTSMGRDQMQGWGGMSGQPKTNPQFPGSWNRPSQGLDQMLQQQQNRQSMNNGNMGQLHIPQGGQMMELARFQQQAAAAQGMRPGAMGWRPQGGADMRQDWASMQANPLFRQMQQINQHGGQLGAQQAAASQGLANIGGHNLPQLAQQQMLQQQLLQQRMQTQQAAQAADAQRAVVNLGSSTKNMEGIVAQGLNVSGKTVEVQQANGQWTRGTIMATMGRGHQGGSALVHLDTGEQKQFSVNDEGRTYNIRMA